VKLLFDVNLSFKLVKALSDIFPESKHVKDLGLDAVGDEVIWNFAQANGFVIVSKDNDFRHWSFLYGAPPKVISITKGNCSTKDLERSIRESFTQISSFLDSGEESLLILD